MLMMTMGRSTKEGRKDKRRRKAGMDDEEQERDKEWIDERRKNSKT